MVDPSLATSEKGLWAVKWSSIVLFAGACFQLGVVFLSGSISLLSDTIHNFGDAGTAVPLGIAFILGRRKANKRFTYGYGKAEDIAGIVVILFMFASAMYALYISIERIFHPQAISHLWVVAVASLVGFVINEGAAIFRIRVGKQIQSQALIADGYHARTDGWSSLAVLFGAIGVWLGFSLADPLVGIIITIVILHTTWNSAKEVFARAIDGVDSDVTEEILHAVNHTPGVKKVSNLRARWIGHTLHTEMTIVVDKTLSLLQTHKIVDEVEANLKSHIPHMSHSTIDVEPSGHSKEETHISELHENTHVHK
jgi:cation diffusion facilitator family transporter